MTVLEEGENAAEVAFCDDGSPEPTRLVLRAREGLDLSAEATDTWWKLGITLPNVDLAAQHLRAAEVEVSEPRQFEDVGYLCHLADPDGHAIELLQHQFGRACAPARADNARFPLGSPAVLGQLTLRVRKPELSLAFYRGLGMTLLSRQPVARFNFTLWFLAFTAERPPDPDLEATANRPWLWQRPYTTLELYARDGQEWRDLAPRLCGLEHLAFEAAGGPGAGEAARIERFSDPDGVPIRIRRC